MPIGYGDGIARSLNDVGFSVLVRGQRAPIVGRIGMDGLMVDVSDISGVGVRDVFTLLGRDGADEITASEMSRAAGTIPQEVLVRMRVRLGRTYSGS